MTSACADGACSQRKVWERLKMYEDTGLEPDRICEFMEKWVKVVELAGLMKQEGIEHLRELVRAEKDSRLVVLPCKVGDTVYMPVGRWKMTGYEPDVCDGFYIARDGILQIKAKNNTGNHGTYGVLGETSFLTREEAEKALKGENKDE